MKGLVLAIAVVAMLLFGCTQYANNLPNAKGLPAGANGSAPTGVKPMTPAENYSGEKEQPYKPTTPAEPFPNETKIGEPTGNGSIPNVSIKQETITGVCHNEVVDADCRNVVSRDDQVHDGTYCTSDDTEVLENYDNVTANCTVEFDIEALPGHTMTYENHTVTLMPHEQSQAFVHRCYCGQACGRTIYGSKLQNVCVPLPGN